MIFDRSFFTERIVVIKRTFPIKPAKINTNANIAPKNVARSVGRTSTSVDGLVKLIFEGKLTVESIISSFILTR